MKTPRRLGKELQLAQTEQAKQGDPWELISKPTLHDAPVTTDRLRFMDLDLLAENIAACDLRKFVENQLGTLPTPLGSRWAWPGRVAAGASGHSQEAS